MLCINFISIGQSEVKLECWRTKGQTDGRNYYSAGP